MLSTLFNKGLKAIQDQANLLESETETLLIETDKAKGSIDKAVESLQTAKNGFQQAKDNVRWLQIEINYKTNHSFKELEELYHLIDDNETDETLFSWLVAEHTPVAVSKVREVTGGYQEYLDSYQDRIEVLESLIKEHGSESNQQELDEVANHYKTIAQGQIDAVNSHLETYGIDVEVR